MEEYKQISKKEYSKLMKKLNRLELENDTLKIEQQLSQMFKHLETSRKYETSTPRHPESRIKFDIPTGRPDDTNASAGLSLEKRWMIGPIKMSQNVVWKI